MCLKARGLIARNGRHSVSIKSWAIPICQKALNPPLHSLPFSLLTDTGNNYVRDRVFAVYPREVFCLLYSLLTFPR